MTTSAENREAPFRAAEEADIVAYRSLSRAALAAAGLGVLSFTALLHPLLLVVPLVAVVAGVVALRSIAVNTEVLSGRWLAVAGLLLAALFAAAAVSREISRDWVVTSRAERFGRAWLQAVVDGRLEVAYEMCLPPTMRQTPGTDLVKYYGGNPEKNEALQQYFDNSPARELAKFGADGQLHYLGVYDAGWSPRQGDLIGLEFEFDYRDAGQPKSTRIHLVVQRRVHRQKGRGQWFVKNVDTPEEQQRRLETIRDLESG